MAENISELLAEIQDLTAKLEVMGFGSDDQSIVHNGIIRPTVAKSIKDKYAAVQAMIQGRKAFATKADMDSDLAHDADTLADVWNDPSELNNGLYGKQGMSGAGSWKKSSYDPINGLIDKERVVTSTNLIDVDDLLYESFTHVASGISESVDLGATNFIRVDEGFTYYFYQPSNRHAIMGFTDKSNDALYGKVGSPGTFGAYTFIMPAGIKYVKIGLKGSGESEDLPAYATFKFGKGNYIQDASFSGNYANDSLGGLPFLVKSGAMRDVLTPKPATANLLDYSSIITGRVIKGPSFNSFYPASGHSISGAIACAAGDVFTFDGVDDVFDRSIMYEDSFGAIIPGSKLTENYEYEFWPGSIDANNRHLTFTIPNNPLIAAFRISVHASDPSYTDRSGRYSIYRGSTKRNFIPNILTNEIDSVELVPEQSIVELYLENLLKRPTSFSDKEFVVIGDSTTSHKGWVDVFARIISPKNLHTYSAGGKRLVSTTGTVDPNSYDNTGPDTAHEVSQDIVNLIINQPDYVVIFLGANEFGKAPITHVDSANIDDYFCAGTSSLIDLSIVDITKIPGALRYIVQTIGEVAPAASFFVVSPIPNSLHVWSDQKNTADSIIASSRRMSVPVVDLHSNSNLLTLWDYPAGVGTARNLGDGTHPWGGTNAAEDQIGSQIASSVLNSIVKIPVY